MNSQFIIHTKASVLLLVFGLVLYQPSVLFAKQAPFNYQGYVTDINGSPLNEESQSITFCIYTTDTGSEKEWCESQPVNIINGLFNVELGSGNPFPEELFDQPPLYLGIQVGNDSEMQPLVEITSAPYAINKTQLTSEVSTQLASAVPEIKYTGKAPVFVNDTTFEIGLGAAADSGDLLTWDSSNWVAKPPKSFTFSNFQPSLAVNFIIALQGTYPSRNAVDPFIGEIIMFAGNFAPRNWAFCNGQLLSIAQNQSLFSILGTVYGGDGRTNFALPDLRGRAPIHAGTGPGLSPRSPGARLGSETTSR